MALTSDADITTLLGGTLSSADAAVLTLMRTRVERLVRKYVGFNIEQDTHKEFNPLREQSELRDSLIEGWEISGNRAVAYGNAVGRNRILRAKNRPIRSVTSIYEDLAATDTAGFSFAAASLLTEGADYAIDYDKEVSSVKLAWSGQIFRKSGAWTEKPRCIQIIYVAGLTAAELAIDGEYPEFSLAAQIAVIKAFNEFKAWQGYAKGGSSVGPVVSTSLGRFSESYGSMAIERATGLTASLPRESMEMLEEYVSMKKYLNA